MISSMKIFKGIGMCLWCCWKDLDDGTYLVRFGIQNVGDINFQK
jgi:hypothetical protein